jgi:TolA-binding protein
MKTWLTFLIVASLCIAAPVASADYAAGVSFYKKQHYAECIRELRAYTEKTPDPRAYYLMGYASYKLRDFSGAREYFRKTYLLDPNFMASSLEIKK